MIVTLLIASLAVVLRIIRQAGWKERGKLARTTRDASSEPGCSCDQEQPWILCRLDRSTLRSLLAWTNFTGFFIFDIFHLLSVRYRTSDIAVKVRYRT